MAEHIRKFTEIKASGTGGKIIREFAGLVNSSTTEASIAKMTSPQGWVEPPQCPEFDEYTLVLSGVVQVECEGSVYDVAANELFIAHRGERVRYSTPHEGGAEYVAICLPAFSPETVHRED